MVMCVCLDFAPVIYSVRVVMVCSLCSIVVPTILIWEPPAPPLCATGAYIHVYYIIVSHIYIYV